jgi:hypothetical protein
LGEWNVAREGNLTPKFVTSPGAGSRVNVEYGHIGHTALLPFCHSQLPTSIKCGVGTFGKLRFFPSPSTLRGPFSSPSSHSLCFFLHILIVNGREGFRRLLCGNPHDYDALLDERVDLGQNAEPIELGNNGGKRREGFGIEFHLVENMRATGTGRAPMSSADVCGKNRRKKAVEGGTMAWASEFE